MKKVYLLVYSDSLGNREQVKGILNNIPQVEKWRFDMPNSFYIISEIGADDLVNLIHEAIMPRTCRFLITELSSSNHQGYLPEDSWTFINMGN